MIDLSLQLAWERLAVAQERVLEAMRVRKEGGDSRTVEKALTVAAYEAGKAEIEMRQMVSRLGAGVTG